jgi:hypothetical protein
MAAFDTSSSRRSVPRIPMVTPDERRAYEITRAAREWTALPATQQRLLLPTAPW